MVSYLAVPEQLTVGCQMSIGSSPTCICTLCTRSTHGGSLKCITLVKYTYYPKCPIPLGTIRPIEPCISYINSVAYSRYTAQLTVDIMHYDLSRDSVVMATVHRTSKRPIRAQWTGVILCLPYVCHPQGSNRPNRKCLSQSLNGGWPSFTEEHRATEPIHYISYLSCHRQSRTASAYDIPVIMATVNWALHD